MRHRVFTYITRGDQLLIFDYVDGRYHKPQIPGGTIKIGELPECAAIREAREETGLSHIQVVSFLGSFERDLSDIGRNETITAWFFHLTTNDKTASRWRHFELDSSEKSEPIEFELYWVPLNDIPKLGGIDEAMLQELKASILEMTHSQAGRRTS